MMVPILVDEMFCNKNAVLPISYSLPLALSSWVTIITIKCPAKEFGLDFRVNYLKKASHQLLRLKHRVSLLFCCLKFKSENLEPTGSTFHPSRNSALTTSNMPIFATEKNQCQRVYSPASLKPNGNNHSNLIIFFACSQYKSSLRTAFSTMIYSRL